MAYFERVIEKKRFEEGPEKDAEIARIKAEILKNPGDRKPRLDLLEVLYFDLLGLDDEIKNHIWWLLENAPDAKADWFHFFMQLQGASGQLPEPWFIERTTNIWRGHLTKDPNNISILYNATQFMTGTVDRDFGFECYRKIIKLDPTYYPAASYFGFLLVLENHKSEEAFGIYKRILKPSGFTYIKDKLSDYFDDFITRYLKLTYERPSISDYVYAAENAFGLGRTKEFLIYSRLVYDAVVNDGYPQSEWDPGHGLEMAALRAVETKDFSHLDHILSRLAEAIEKKKMNAWETEKMLLRSLVKNGFKEKAYHLRGLYAVNAINDKPKEFLRTIFDEG